MIPHPSYHILASATSTNSCLSAIAANSPHGTVVAAVEQTAGRGQRGNSWEAAPGKNITLSILLRPQHIDARSQFAISQIVSLAIVNTLHRYIPCHNVTIKWPNDIYVGDRKICGILIENSLMGMAINHSIAGIGLNVNQQRFLSDAPNPVSLFQLTGEEVPIEEIRQRLCEEILSMMHAYDNPALAEELHNRYLSTLWRRDGFHPYIADGITFEARIGGVDRTGILTLTRRDGSSHPYAFKEVTAIL